MFKRLRGSIYYALSSYEQKESETCCLGRIVARLGKRTACRYPWLHGRWSETCRLQRSLHKIWSNVDEPSTYNKATLSWINTRNDLQRIAEVQKPLELIAITAGWCARRRSLQRSRWTTRTRGNSGTRQTRVNNSKRSFKR